MQDIIDLQRYPIDNPNCAGYAQLVQNCQDQLAAEGLFNLASFMKPQAIKETLQTVKPMIADHAFTHSRRHNIYFKKTIDGLADDHPALRQYDTTNHTVCADQTEGSHIVALYDWPPLARFLADVMGKPALHPMDDRIACANVMTYYEGEALNWHFDRSEFTTTLLLQTPKAGGEFEYVKDLRSADNPNYEGVSALYDGNIATKICPQTAGTLNVFKGVNTAHRVTPVVGDNPRINAVLTYYEQAGAKFSEVSFWAFTAARNHGARSNKGGLARLLARAFIGQHGTFHGQAPMIPPQIP